MSEDKPLLVNCRTAQRLLSISRSSIAKLVRQKKLLPVKLLSQRLFRYSDILELLAKK